MYAWTGLVAGTAVAVAFVPWPYAAGGFIVGLVPCCAGAPVESMGAEATEHWGRIRPLRAADGPDSSLG